jgi:hypothetical protein
MTPTEIAALSIERLLCYAAEQTDTARGAGLLGFWINSREDGALIAVRFVGSSSGRRLRNENKRVADLLEYMKCAVLGDDEAECLRMRAPVDAYVLELFDGLELTEAQRTLHHEFVREVETRRAQLAELS